MGNPELRPSSGQPFPERHESLGREALNFYEATLRVLSDWPPKPVEVVFFHGRSFGDETGLFELVSEMYRLDAIRYVALFNNEGERVGSTIPYQANPGKTYYSRRLQEMGVDPNRILLADPAYHTRQENETFCKLAQREGWKSAVIVTQPHQLLRAMLGMAKVMEETSYWMEVYTAAPRTTPWLEIVGGSQGLERKPRLAHIQDEFNRILAYQQKGDLASFEKFFAYLINRDQLSSG